MSDKVQLGDLEGTLVRVAAIGNGEPARWARLAFNVHYQDLVTLIGAGLLESVDLGQKGVTNPGFAVTEHGQAMLREIEQKNPEA